MLSKRQDCSSPLTSPRLSAVGEPCGCSVLQVAMERQGPPSLLVSGPRLALGYSSQIPLSSSFIWAPASVQMNTFLPPL